MAENQAVAAFAVRDYRLGAQGGGVQLNRSTAPDDGATDQLLGGAGMDYFWGQVGSDSFLDFASGEVRNVI